MTQAVITKKLNKTASELADLIVKSKRKLLELEVMMGVLEIKKARIQVQRNKVISQEKLFKKLGF